MPTPGRRFTLTPPPPESIMRALSLLVLLTASPALAGTETLSTDIGKNGLAAVEAQLAALSARAPDEQFALAGVRFLRVIEQALQTQLREGIADPSGFIPFARLMAGTPQRTEPMRAEAMAELLTEATAGLEAARAPLDELAPDADFAVTVDLKDIWFDLNADGARAPGESALDILGPQLMGWRWSERDPTTPAPVIRFDSADAAWLSAYTHLLGGVGDLLLAYDPTPAYQRLINSQMAFQTLNMQPAPGPDDMAADWTLSIQTTIDSIAPLVWMLRHDPDRARMTSARGHLQAMIADNRQFWTMVAAETDNDREWLPNDSQTAALGISVPQGTGARWLAVLDDLDALLSGQKLLPYWRTGGGAGVNIARFFDDPAPIDLADWIQGAGAVPYLEKGTLVTGESWGAFDSLLLGDSFLFSVYLN